MKNFKNCEPVQLQKDLRHLIAEHYRIEGHRRIQADQRLAQLQAGLDEVNDFIKLQSNEEGRES